MVDAVTYRRLGHWAVFLSLVVLTIFLQLMPLHLGRDDIPAPDLISQICFVWVLRRPEYIPVWLIALAGFCADILLMGPPGLGAIALIVGTEFLRRRSYVVSEQPFVVEWALVAAVLLGTTLFQWFAMAALAAPHPPLGEALVPLAVTVVTYPFVMVFNAYGLGIRQASPAEKDAEARI
ncbi:rod shape-determining protein MreD [Palleronia caenipelagi]|uniref:Rod shape-determining protein MreD n=1 Tax=Palleronia caenipelagi TaxID=2489174 RepID=A0A547QAS1_9RHOB|nr:rod shape-determining protein MreD [Palleronia caenipelagi]TRD23482.1 rod shape-determining protein MreD [Palleronia caenipelagi]